MKRMVLAGVLACAMGLAGDAAVRADDTVFELKVTGGHFEPAEVMVPADSKFQLHVINADAAAIEFESFELHRERVVQPGETITVYLPALTAGSYPFFDDFHSDTPHGAIVAK